MDVRTTPASHYSGEQLPTASARRAYGRPASTAANSRQLLLHPASVQWMARRASAAAATGQLPRRPGRELNRHKALARSKLIARSSWFRGLLLQCCSPPPVRLSPYRRRAAWLLLPYAPIVRREHFSQTRYSRDEVELRLFLAAPRASLQQRCLRFRSPQANDRVTRCHHAAVQTEIQFGLPVSGGRSLFDWRGGYWPPPPLPGNRAAISASVRILPRPSGPALQLHTPVRPRCP